MRRSVVQLCNPLALVAALAAVAIGCKSDAVGIEATNTIGLAGYDLLHPERVFELPSVLVEVSGLSDISASAVGCVQDELGTIFVYDLERRTITSRIHFGEPGDYEGLSFVDGSFYVLRSDGTVFKVTGEGKHPTVERYTLDAATRNHEGLGHDARHHRLLIAAKSPAGKGRANKNRRVVFGFDVTSKEFAPEPVLDIDVVKVKRFAESTGMELPRKTNKKGRTREFLRFLPASIAVHPETDQLYVLSAIDRTLAVFDRKGEIQAFTTLPASLFPQPEGVTFLPGGDMVVTNEGADNVATLLVFHWEKKVARLP